MAGVKQGQVENEGAYQRRSCPATNANQQGGKSTQQGGSEERCITGVQPEQGWQVQVTLGTTVGCEIGQPQFDWNYSLAASQSLNLYTQGGEGDQVDNTQQAQEHRRDQSIAVGNIGCHRL